MRVVDYCACGRPFRARTKLMMWHCHPDAALSQMVCHGRGVCSFSGRPHQQLSGSDKNGFLTALKNAYPDKLCAALARTFKGAILRHRAVQRWRHFGGTSNTMLEDGKVGEWKAHAGGALRRSAVQDPVAALGTRSSQATWLERS